MRRELVVFAAILAVVLIAGLAARSLVTRIAVSEIKNAFPGYDISIGGAEVRNIDMVAISDINAKKGTAVSCIIKGLEIRFSPVSLFTRMIPRVVIKNAVLQIRSPGKGVKDIINYPVFKTGKGFMAESIAIFNSDLILDTADWNLNVVSDGNIELQKTPAGGLMVSGDLSSLPGEWTLTVRDEALLKELAAKAEQSPSAFDDLKDFNFTKANLHISGNPGSILFHLKMDGAKGKKDLVFSLDGF